MSADWWSKKLGMVPQQQPQTPSPAPQQAPPTPGLPGQLFRPPPQPQHAQQAPYQPPPQQQQPVEQPQTMGEAMELAKAGIIQSQGGFAAKAGETAHCPSCGSNNYVVMANHGKINQNTGQMMHTGGRCFDCGYPIIQSGSDTGILSGVPLST